MRYLNFSLLFILLQFNLACTQKKNEQNTTTQSVEKVVENDSLLIGKKWVMSIRDTIGKSLLSAIKENGTVGAIEFCSLEANNIVQTKSNELGTTVKRVSDKPRNPNNAASKEELAYIEACKKMLANNENLKPKLQYINGKTLGYYPIVTNGMCMQCHGTPMKNIEEEVLSVIQNKYPNDKAINYKPNEVRGLFVVAF